MRPYDPLLLTAQVFTPSTPRNCLVVSSSSYYDQSIVLEKRRPFVFESVDFLRRRVTIPPLPPCPHTSSHSITHHLKLRVC